VRLDLFLKASGLVLRRTIAQQLCERGRVNVNGAAAKASKEVKVDDMIEIIRGENRLVAKVLEIQGSKQVSKQAAGSLVEIVSSERREDPLLT